MIVAIKKLTANIPITIVSIIISIKKSALGWVRQALGD